MDLSSAVRAPRGQLESRDTKHHALTWEEQAKLFKELPSHLAEMALFVVNNGCRDSEICTLRWEWEMKIPSLETSVFIIPGQYVKNAGDRLVVLNRIAASVVEARGGKHETHVFTFREQTGRPHAEQRLETGAGESGSEAGSGSRSQAHLHKALTRRRDEL